MAEHAAKLASEAEAIASGIYDVPDPRTTTFRPKSLRERKPVAPAKIVESLVVHSLSPERETSSKDSEGACQDVDMALLEDQLGSAEADLGSPSRGIDAEASEPSYGGNTPMDVETQTKVEQPQGIVTMGYQTAPTEEQTSVSPQEEMAIARAMVAPFPSTSIATTHSGVTYPVNTYHGNLINGQASLHPSERASDRMEVDGESSARSGLSMGKVFTTSQSVMGQMFVNGFWETPPSHSYQQAHPHQDLHPQSSLSNAPLVGISAVNGFSGSSRSGQHQPQSNILPAPVAPPESHQPSLQFGTQYIHHAPNWIEIAPRATPTVETADATTAPRFNIPITPSAPISPARQPSYQASSSMVYQTPESPIGPRLASWHNRLPNVYGTQPSAGDIMERHVKETRNEHYGQNGQ